jgi:hypothetical protein
MIVCGSMSSSIHRSYRWFTALAGPSELVQIILVSRWLPPTTRARIRSYPIPTLNTLDDKENTMTDEIENNNAKVNAAVIELLKSGHRKLTVKERAFVEKHERLHKEIQKELEEK